MHPLIQYVETACSSKQALGEVPDFKSGDMVNVHVKIQEGSKVRVQEFQGTVIRRKKSGLFGETFTVRKVIKEVGVERIFPLHSPNIDKIEVKKRGVVRRARLYYLRGKKGKAIRIKELRK